MSDSGTPHWVFNITPRCLIRSTDIWHVAMLFDKFLSDFSIARSSSFKLVVALVIAVCNSYWNESFLSISVGSVSTWICESLPNFNVSTWTSSFTNRYDPTRTLYNKYRTRNSLKYKIVWNIIPSSDTRFLVHTSPSIFQYDRWYPSTVCDIRRSLPEYFLYHQGYSRSSIVHLTRPLSQEVLRIFSTPFLISEGTKWKQRVISLTYYDVRVTQIFRILSRSYNTQI